MTEKASPEMVEHLPSPELPRYTETNKPEWLRVSEVTAETSEKAMIIIEKDGVTVTYDGANTVIKGVGHRREAELLVKEAIQQYKERYKSK